MIGTRIYKNWKIDSIETFVIFNIHTLTVFTWFLLDIHRDNAIILILSTGVTYLIPLVAVIKANCLCRARCCKRKYQLAAEDDAIELAEREPEIKELQQRTQTVIEFPKQKQL